MLIENERNQDNKQPRTQCALCWRDAFPGGGSLELHQSDSHGDYLRGEESHIVMSSIMAS